MLEDITAAGFNRDKATPLRSAIDRLNRLRVLLRLAHELRVLSHDQYAFAATAMNEAGAQLAGWLRHNGRAGPAGVASP